MPPPIAQTQELTNRMNQLGYDLPKILAILSGRIAPPPELAAFLGPRPTYEGVDDPFMQQLIGEMPEGAGVVRRRTTDPRGLGTEGQVITKGVQGPRFSDVNQIWEAFKRGEIGWTTTLKFLSDHFLAIGLGQMGGTTGTEMTRAEADAAAEQWLNNMAFEPEDVPAGSLPDSQVAPPGPTSGVPVGEFEADADIVAAQQRAIDKAAGPPNLQVVPEGLYGTDFSRAEALSQQREIDPRSVYRRMAQEIPGYSEFNPFVRSSIQNRYNDARSRLRLAQVDDPTLGFESFLGGGGFAPGDPVTMRGQLGNLQSMLLREPGINPATGTFWEPDAEGRISSGEKGSTAIRDYFTSPGGDPMQGRANILSALMQPGLETVAPSLRGNYASGLSNAFNVFQALRPEADILGEFGRRGYF
jgi:hypothetical protein